MHKGFKGQIVLPPSTRAKEEHKAIEHTIKQAVPDSVAEFLARGGKITTHAPGETGNRILSNFRSHTRGVKKA